MAKDQIDVRPTGEIDVTIDDVKLRLRRPKMGEMRAREEALAELGRLEADERAAAKTEKRAARGFEPELLGWWVETVELLETKGATLDTDVDDLPPWLANTELILEVRQVWRAVPWGPGGRPTAAK